MFLHVGSCINVQLDLFYVCRTFFDTLREPVRVSIMRSGYKFPHIRELQKRRRYYAKPPCYYVAVAGVIIPEEAN